MTTSGRVVPTALAASPAAPLPLEAAVPLLVDQDGRLLVNVASSVFPPPVPPPTPPPITKQLLAFDNTGIATVFVSPITVQRVTVTLTSGAGFLQLWTGPLPPFVNLLYAPIPIPTTLPAYIDIEFDTIDGLAAPFALVVAVSLAADSYSAPAPLPPGFSFGLASVSYT